MNKERVEKNLYDGALVLALQLKQMNKEKYNKLMLKLMGQVV